MPKKTVDRIYRYIHELNLAGGDKSVNVRYGKYIAALSELVNLLEPFYKKDAEGKQPTLSDRDRRMLQGAYRKTIEVGVLFLSQNKKDAKHIKQLTHVVTQVNQMLTAELVALTGVLSGDKVTIEQINNNAHSYMIDITNKEIHTVSGAQTSRIPVKFTKDGKTHEGFFTEEKKFNPDQEMEQFLNTCSSVNGVVNPRYRKFFDKAMKNRTLLATLKFGGGGKIYLNELDGLIEQGVQDRTALVGYFRGLINSIDPSFMDLANDADFSLGMFKFVKDYAALASKKILNEEFAGIEQGSPMEVRNAAFSAVADLLGVSSSVARTVKMQVKDGDVIRDGIFMEKANGYDVRNLTEDNPLMAFAQEDISKGAPNETLEGGISVKAIKDLMNIQVLDYICGNVDRHSGNMFYSVNMKNATIDGIQAIDNGTSFGRLRADDVIEPRNNLGGLYSIKKMDRATASHILGLTPEVLTKTLRPFGLSEQEISACIDRTKALQERISMSMFGSMQYRLSENSITLYGAADWKELDFEELTDDTSMIGDFIRGFRRAITVNAEKQEQDRKRKEFLDKIDENLLADPAAIYADGDYYGAIPPNVKGEIAELKSDLQNAKKGFFIGTKKFDKVEDALDEVVKLEKKPNADRSVKYYRLLESKYQQVIAKAEYYLKKKEAKENELLRDGKVPSEHFLKRVAFVEKVALFAGKQLEKTTHDRKLLVEKINTRRRMAEENIAFDWEIIPSIQKDPASDVKDRVLEDLNQQIKVNEATVKKIAGNEENLAINELNANAKEEKLKEKEAKGDEVSQVRQ